MTPRCDAPFAFTMMKHVPPLEVWKLHAGGRYAEAPEVPRSRGPQGELLTRGRGWVAPCPFLVQNFPYKVTNPKRVPLLQYGFWASKEE